MTIKAPNKIPQEARKFKVFLAGSIEMGIAENWQLLVEKQTSTLENLYLLNPRRDDWNTGWKQHKNNPQFAEQVNWELDAMQIADLIVMYFSPDTHSPVTLLELGLHANSGKLVVCCPEGFWRKGNVDIVCDRYLIPQVDSLTQLIELIKTKQQL